MKLIKVIFSLLALLITLAPAYAQLTIPALRVDAPIFPATGIWWSGSDGAGRWGLQVELQRRSSENDAILSVAVFSYEGTDNSRQAWYVANEIYPFNESWRDDGFIARLPLNLRRTQNGTCLTCPDGMNTGENAPPDVERVDIEFVNSTNAVLTVDGVQHGLTKAEFGTAGTGTQGFWARPFQLQLETAIDQILPDNGLSVTYVDTVIPTLRRSRAEFRGIRGWDVYNFDARGVVEIITIGPIFESVSSQFELYVHPELNEYHLVRAAATEFEQLPVAVQIFPLGRYVMEGRSKEIFPSGDGRNVVSQALLISTPGMRSAAGEALPYPLAR